MQSIPKQTTVNRVSLRRIAGQGMTEYIIIVALIAVAAIGVYSLFGESIRNQVAGMAMEITGQSASEALNEGSTAARSAETLGTKDVSLGNYDEVTRNKDSN
ncbi:MAG: pilus assembly protein [Idiomarina sp.]|uniref:Flp family type IVb pilin n=1 Tax=Idiomarina sp. TaxID=1874361 RepID=UPI000C0F9C54|nr:pilus assembly protein [Idiomarina sp.]MAK71212.1 pilus assembly protein [Idiomarinaceae bacterium]MBL4742716.1 pilus assembly protein [Idiomarina sp.]MBT42390.1 pilus assembly protein [Idiomarina sp.]PHQ74785.1 MAG: pilus assembly protein [Idiomarina sp.]HAD47771.1 pilus assembly protein [Idiomarina sp.]